jgi:hypothetical protein
MLLGCFSLPLQKYLLLIKWTKGKNERMAFPSN